MSRPPKVRVCIVVASIDMLGGQAVQAERLLEGLSREPGVEAFLLPINPRLPRPLRFLQRIKYVRTIVTSMLYVATLLIRLRHCDVVHVFSASYFSFLLAPTPAVLIARLYGKAVLLNYHSGEAEDHLRRWPVTALPVLKMADRVVVPSGYLVEIFGRFGIRAEAIANTVDPTRFVFRERDRFAPVLFSCRSLEHLYNIPCTLRAFAIVQRRVPEARLIVAGDGTQRGALQVLSSGLGLRNVEFVGSVAQDAIPPLFDRCDIFVNASDVDNMPLSIIEAFACGLAVVTTDAGGIPCLVTDDGNGLLVARGDHDALARGVLALLDDPRRAKRLAAAAFVDSHRYTWPAVRDAWLSAYRELADARHRASEQVAPASSRKSRAFRASIPRETNAGTEFP